GHRGQRRRLVSGARAWLPRMAGRSALPPGTPGRAPGRKGDGDDRDGDPPSPARPWRSRFLEVIGFWCVHLHRHGAPNLIGRPAGTSFWQAWLAFWNCGELGSTPLPNDSDPFAPAEIGRPRCVMHLAYLARPARLPGEVALPGPTPGSNDWHAWLAAWT